MFDGGDFRPGDAGATLGTVLGWTLTRNPDRAATWTSPAGKTYTVHPLPYGDHH